MATAEHSRPPRHAELTASALALQVGFALSEVGTSRLWTDCVAHGGRISLGELRLALRGLGNLAPVEHNIAAASLNEHLSRRGLGRPVAYFEEL